MQISNGLNMGYLTGFRLEIAYPLLQVPVTQGSQLHDLMAVGAAFLRRIVRFSRVITPVEDIQFGMRPVMGFRS